MLKTFRYDDVPVLETTSGKLKGYFYDGEYIFTMPMPTASRCLFPPSGKGSRMPLLTASSAR